MPDSPDPITLSAIRAGLAHLVNAARLAGDLRHQLDLAESCSDLCISPQIARHFTALSLAIAKQHGFVTAVVHQEEARLSARGIHARTKLPASTHDHLFKLVAVDGKTLCVMEPGEAGFDGDYHEEVPMP